MKILIIGPAWVGDMVMSQSLYMAIKQQFPDAILHVMAPGWCLPLLERMQAAELARYGITVNCLAPAARTAMTEAGLPSDTEVARHTASATKYPATHVTLKASRASA